MSPRAPRQEQVATLPSDLTRPRRLISGQRLSWPVAAGIIAVLSLVAWSLIVWVIWRLMAA